MESRDFDDFQYKYIKDDKTQNKDCFVIETTSKDPKSPYSKSLIWIAKDDYFTYKIEAYDRKDDQLLKTIVFVEVKTLDGVIIPVKTVVDNQKDGTKTLLSMSDIKINSGIKDENFTIQNLEK